MVSEALGTAPDLARASSRPAYVRIEQWLTSCIVDGSLVPGDKLPREEAARRVARRQPDDAAAGAVRPGGRRHHRAAAGRQGGTFVAQPRIVCDLTGLAGFTEQMRRAHVRAGARVVSAVTRPASRTEARALGLDTAGTVHEVVRVRSADREPLAIEQACFPAALFPDLLEQRLTGSLYRLLDEAVRPRAAHRERGARAGHLLPPSRPGCCASTQGSPLMLIERTAFTASGVAVEHAHDVFRPTGPASPCAPVSATTPAPRWRGRSASREAGAADRHVRRRQVDAGRGAGRARPQGGRRGRRVLRGAAGRAPALAGGRGRAAARHRGRTGAVPRRLRAEPGPLPPAVRRDRPAHRTAGDAGRAAGHQDQQPVRQGTGRTRRFLADVAEVEPLLRRVADHVVDTSAPLPDVVATVLRVSGVTTTDSVATPSGHRARTRRRPHLREGIRPSARSSRAAPTPPPSPDTRHGLAESRW